MKLRLIPALLPVLFLAGCHSGTPNPTTVAAATPQHNFHLYGSPTSGEFMVDNTTGTVWYLNEIGSQKTFVPIDVIWPDSAGPPPGAKIRDWHDLK